MISMKMSASWDAEKSSSSMIPRLCNLNLGQIILDHPFDAESRRGGGFYVAVRLRDSPRRVLRSSELVLPTPSSSSSFPSNDERHDLQQPPPQSINVIPLDFQCNIQYSHALNRGSVANTLQILIQRRKKYKNKTMNLGYKSLAYCNINLDQVLQRRMEGRLLDFYPDPKCLGKPVGRFEVQHLSSAPLEKYFLEGGKRKGLYGTEEDDEAFTDESDPTDDDQLMMMDDEGIAGQPASSHRRLKPIKSMFSGQKQFKRKLIGMLKKLRIGDPSEDEDMDRAEQKLWDELQYIQSISDVEEEDDSDVDGNDNSSLLSTPKPTLRPFFSTTGSSEETIGGDASAKLLKRLQRQLLEQERRRQESSPPPGFSPLHFSPNYQQQEASAAVATPSTTNRGRGSRMSTGGLVKRFAHIRRRSQVPGSAEGSQRGKRSLLPSIKQTVNEAAPGGPTGSSTILHSTSSDENVPADNTGEDSQDSRLGPASFSIDGSRQSTTEVDPFLLTRSLLPVLSCDRSEELSSTTLSVLQNYIFFTNSSESTVQPYADFLSRIGLRLHRLSSFAETKQIFTRLSNQVKTRSLHSSAPPEESDASTTTPTIDQLIHICLLGASDALVGLTLRAYVDQLSSRSAELASRFRFYPIPIGPSSGGERRCNNNTALASYLARVDSAYGDLFWQSASTTASVDPIDLMNRLSYYLLKSQTLLSLPIGCCLLVGAATNKAGDPNTDPTSSAVGGGAVTTSTTSGSTNEQLFIPFLHHVRLGSDQPTFHFPGFESLYGLQSTDHNQSSGSLLLAPPQPEPVSTSDVDDLQSGQGISIRKLGKRSQSPDVLATSPVGHSSSRSYSSSQPPQHTTGLSSSQPLSQAVAADTRFHDIQLEYWVDRGLTASSSQQPAESTSGHQHQRRHVVKCHCRALSVALSSALRLRPPNANSVLSPIGGQSTVQSTLVIGLWAKEKSKKISFIGRKGKEVQYKYDLVDNIQRFLCTNRSSDHGSVQEAPVSAGSVGPTTSDSILPDSRSFRVTIDGVEWSDLTFFQVSPSWRTCIKSFPVALISSGQPDKGPSLPDAHHQRQISS